MSSDDGDNGGPFDFEGNEPPGWYDQPPFQDEPQPIYESHNDNAPEGWWQWEDHDVEGSHWQTEPIYYDTLDDAIRATEDMRENPLEYMEPGTTAGEFADIDIYYDPDLDQYYTIGDVFVEY